MLRSRTLSKIDELAVTKSMSLESEYVIILAVIKSMKSNY